MKLDFWLIVSEDEAVSVRKRTPHRGALREGEVAIPVTLTVPDEWFDARTNVVDLVVPERELADATGKTGEPTQPEWQMPEGMVDAYGLDGDEEAQP